MPDLDYYTCEHVFRLLDDYLDRELSPEEMRTVKEHLDTCAMCASEHQFQAEALAAVRQRLQRIAVSSSLREKVTQALQRAQEEGG